MSGVAPSSTSLYQCSMVLCTASPRTSDPPFGSGRPAPYLNHHFAEQLRNVLAWLGERISPRVSFLVGSGVAGRIAVEGGSSGRNSCGEGKLSDMTGSVLADVDERA